MDLSTQLSAFMSMLIPALLAALCGSVVGMERELRDKPAGLKTNALICLGAAMYVHLGELLIQEGGGDPTRIPGQVITGMGFLGAGVILREGGAVLGLTTAATLWTVTAIGLFIGSRHYALALLLTATTVGVLIVLRLIERLLAGMRLSDGKRPDALSPRKKLSTSDSRAG
jgi:putative Mg2+ transporter-C (MgtC) family protein